MLQEGFHDYTYSGQPWSTDECEDQLILKARPHVVYNPDEMKCVHLESVICSKTTGLQTSRQSTTYTITADVKYVSFMFQLSRNIAVAHVFFPW